MKEKKKEFRRKMAVLPALMILVTPTCAYAEAAPKTGDSTSLLWPVLITVVAFVALILIFTLGRKKK